VHEARQCMRQRSGRSKTVYDVRTVYKMLKGFKTEYTARQYIRQESVQVGQCMRQEDV
jgi:hypothetical protein